MANPEETRVGPTPRVRRLVGDAVALLDYAIGSGFKTPEGRSISQDTISAIETTAVKLGIREGRGSVVSSSPDGDAGSISQGVAQSRTVSAEEWIAFEIAFYTLTSTMSPITVETLRDTDKTSRQASAWPSDHSHPPWWRRLWTGLGDVLLGFSPAQRFARCLAAAAIVFALVVVFSEWWLKLLAYAPDAADEAKHRTARTLIEGLVPWAYGGLGSCVFLLRSAHTYIYQRTFDLRRKPEYVNRVLLGTIAGGAIILFINQVVGEEGAVIQLSSAALGFLAGYSTDFLFTTIERIIAALLPKVGVETVRRAAPPPPPQSLDVKDLLERRDRANQPERRFYERLIEHATGTPLETPSAKGGNGQSKKAPRQDAGQ